MVEETPKEPDEMDCIVVTPDNVLYEGKAKRVMAPGVYGEIAILPIHTPLYSELKEGVITIYLDQGEKEIPVESGVVRARSNKVSIILGF